MSNRNKWETTPKLPNPCPGHNRYSKNCDKSFYTKKKKDKGKDKEKEKAEKAAKKAEKKAKKEKKMLEESLTEEGPA